MAEDLQNESPIKQISLSELREFPDHPFNVKDDEKMKEMVESIRENGVLIPAIARPLVDGSYELISGHRRKHACEILGLDTMPVIVRELDRNKAMIVMVDSNLQRENILPSERARAYKMKFEAMKRQGVRTDLTSCQLGTKLRTDEKIAENTEDSARTVQRYIHLTELDPELLQMVDDKKIAFTPAVEISYLRPEEQKMLIDTIESEQATPSLSQAQRLKKLSQSGELTDDSMLSIMSEQKKPEKNCLTIPAEVIEKYFPKSFTPVKMQEVIIKLLESWQRKRQQNHER